MFKNKNLSSAEKILFSSAEASQEVCSQQSQDIIVNSSSTAALHQLFEAQVERTPEAIAIVAESEALTYEQLNQQANRLAHHLKSLGVGPDRVVGLFVERSPTMVVAMLGILKAGGAYLPLDPEHPPDRIASILAEAEVALVLCLSHLTDKLPEQTGKVICLELLDLGHYPDTNPGCEVEPDRLAYVIYTSGSTGKPKGVMIPHAGICNQLYWRQSTFPLMAGDRVLQNISFSFDPSVWQIFWPLSWGEQLVLPKPGGQRDIAYLVQLIAEEGVTILALVPSILRAFLDQKKSAHCTALRHVFCGGEALPTVLQEEFLAAFGQTTQLHNVYGPTEASIDATYWTCQPGDEAKIAPIGRPIANAEVYILDEQLQPVSPGASGELYIGGRGLARGYLQQPLLTRERFIPHPFSTDVQARLYKTGDLVRCRADENLEFLGRIDSQVKVRGFRIELQEIEAVLSQHQSVAGSAVVTRTDSANNAYLVAYIVFCEKQQTTQQALRQFLQAKLPDYMVPACFIVLSEMPLNANGKIDKKALPEPEFGRQVATTDFLAPEQHLELVIAKVWENYLHIKPIGIHDSFFELGGNSLLAASMLAQVEDSLNQQVPLGTFFQAPTIANLVSYLDGTSEERTEKSLVVIRPHGSRPPLFFVHDATGNVGSYHPLVQHLDRQQPIYGLQSRGLDGRETTHTRVEEMAIAYIEEMRSVQPTGPYFLCGYSFGGLVAYEMASQLERQGEEVALLTLIDTFCLRQAWFTRVKSIKWLKGKVKRKLRLSLYKLRQKALTAMGSPLAASTTASPEAVLTTIRAINDQLITTYEPPTYDRPVTLLRANQLPETKDFEVKKMDDSLGWSSLVTGDLTIYPIPCDHFNMLKEPHVREVAVQLEACLATARAAAQEK